jgi:DNA replication licensing factor MCM3
LTDFFQCIDRLKTFRSRVAASFQKNFASEDSISLEALLPIINEGLQIDDLFGTDDAIAILNKMNDENLIMFAEGTVYKL